MPRPRPPPEQRKPAANPMAVDIWATIDAMLHVAAGRLSAARAAAESLPPPEPTSATELDMVRTVVLAEVAVHTDDRNLLRTDKSETHRHDLLAPRHAAGNANGQR